MTQRNPSSFFFSDFKNWNYDKETGKFTYKNEAEDIFIDSDEWTVIFDNIQQYIRGSNQSYPLRINAIRRNKTPDEVNFYDIKALEKFVDTCQPHVHENRDPALSLFKKGQWYLTLNKVLLSKDPTNIVEPFKYVKDEALRFVGHRDIVKYLEEGVLLKLLSPLGEGVLYEVDGEKTKKTNFQTRGVIELEQEVKEYFDSGYNINKTIKVEDLNIGH